MSDKNKSGQNKPSNDNAPTSDTASAANTDDQQGLSASISLTPSSSGEKPSTQNSQPVGNDNEKKSNVKKDSEKSNAPVKKTTTPEKPQVSKSTEQKNKLSKTAVIAVLIALLAIAASAGHYYWNEQQKAQYSQQLNDGIQQQLQLNQSQISQQLQQQEQQNNSQLKMIEASVQRNTESNVKQLQQQLAKLQQQMVSLSQNQPSDWLLHEAEYLIRVASRSLWLEKDTTAAIGLLTDAERRIQELNDPQFLPLRQVIQQDIASLQLLPKLNTDEVILKLMALDTQISKLPLSQIEKPKNLKQTENNNISDNASDWKENIAKVWKRFISDYITVSYRTGNVEPLMSPNFQQNLRENLSLKLQTAIWSARKADKNLYLSSLTDVQTWLVKYFDMEDRFNQNFNQAIELIKTKTIGVDYPNNLQSLEVVRKSIQNVTTTPEPSNIPTEKKPSEVQQQSTPVKSEPNSDNDLTEGE